MKITVDYADPIEIRKKKKGEWLKKYFSSLYASLPLQATDQVKKSCGVYIYYKRTGQGKLTARYVGVNTNKHLLGEALRKRHVLKKLTKAPGTSFLLLLPCDRPKGMFVSKFERRLLELETALIADLYHKHHDLENLKKVPGEPHFDFDSSRKSKAAMTDFKKLVKRRPPMI